MKCPHCGSTKTRVLDAKTRECWRCTRRFEDSTPSRESVSIIDAGELLGVSRWTIYRLIAERKLQAFMVRGTKRIHLAELRRFKKENTIVE